MMELMEERDSVAIDKGTYEIYIQLTEGANPEMAPFRTMKDVFMWAACQGFHRGEKRPLAQRKGIFKWAQFSEQLDVPLLRAIAIATTDDVNVLASQDKVLRIAEEYANSGIHELNSILLQSDGQPLWNLVENTKSLFESNKA
jgi:dnd system-associated protein 4